MNNFTTPGISLEFADQSSTNTPYSGMQTFLLIVISGTGNRRIQVTMSFDNGDWHRRFRKNIQSANMWTAWEKF